MTLLEPENREFLVGRRHRTLCDVEMLVYDYDQLGAKTVILPSGSVFQPWNPLDPWRGVRVPITLGDSHAAFDWGVDAAEGHFLRWDDFFSRCEQVEDIIKVPWRLTYHDGNNNRFRFWQNAKVERVHVEYVPISPELSSSGLYSGGKPKRGVVDDTFVEDLWQWERKLESDTTLHAGSRTKGSGAFSLATADGVRDFVIKNGPLLRAFQELLGPFRNV